ncbi:MAG TPA: glycosyltransferase family 4 protein [Dongiaceae bacterium]
MIWRSLARFAPGTARRYCDRLIRGEVRRCRTAAGADGPLTVVGGFGLNIGIARAAQILCSSLEAAGLPVYPMDCSAVLRPMPGPPARRPAAPARGTILFCVNPPQMAPLLTHFGPRICRGKRLVGYWWWELDRLPRAWIGWAELMDEIWVSSRFIHDTFVRELPRKTIRYVPLCVPEPTPSAAARRDFGLQPHLFAVLVAFDLSSHWERKNPRGAIAAFQRAFPDGAAQLVLKISGAGQHPEQLETLRALTAGMSNVRIIQDNLPDGDLAALIQACDVLLSLHRAEGLGLFISEAMWLGTPVIATAWSGVLDMLSDDNALLIRCRPVPVRPEDYPSVMPGALWAEPDIDHAAACLRLLAGDAGLRNRLRIEARRRAETLFSADQFRDVAGSLLHPLSGPRAPSAPRPLA